jgi:hypothetical protein
LLGKKKSDVIDYSGQVKQPYQQYQQYQQPIPPTGTGPARTPTPAQYQTNSPYSSYSPYETYEPYPQQQIPPQQVPPAPQFLGQQTNQYTYLAPPEDDKKKKKKLLTIVLIVIIIISVISIALMNIFSEEDTSDEESDVPVRLNASEPKRSNYGWEILISMVAGGNPKLSSLRFEIKDNKDFTLVNTYLTDAKPAKVSMDIGDIYAVPEGSGSVQDSSTGYVISDNSTIENFEYCHLVYLDSDRDFELTPGDKIYIIKDFDKDGTKEIFKDDYISIYFDNQVILKKTFN